MKIIIIGCGAAGYYAAKRIRTIRPEAETLLLEAAPEPLYAKIRLPGYVAGKIARDALFLTNQGKLSASGIDAHFSEPVETILRMEKSVLTRSGKLLKYDKLILATGAKAFLPPIPGFHCVPEVRTLRTLADADRLTGDMKTAGSALVLGGGLLGLEMAGAFRERGLKTTVLEAGNALLSRRLDQEEAARLEDLLSSQGIKIVLNAEAIRCQPAAPEKSGAKLSLKDGRTFLADILFVSTGITPEISLAKAAGLSCGRAILTGEDFRTSDPDIFAAGDCAERNGYAAGLWIASKEQGEAAADAACGAENVSAPKNYRPKLRLSLIDFDAVLNHCGATNRGPQSEKGRA